MNPAVNRAILIAVIVAGVAEPLSWIFSEWTFCKGGVCHVSGTPPEWDFTIFWEAGRLALSHDFRTIFVFSVFHAEIEKSLHYDIGMSPFAYPPTALLIFTPLALLSLQTAYLVWTVLGAALLVSALRIAGLRFSGCAMVLLSPPFLYNLMLGQNGAFSGALLIFALTLAARRPGIAGLAGAFLTIKPQIGLLLPAAWVGARRWKTAAYAGMGFGTIMALTICLFGFRAWQLYFYATLPEMTRIMNAPFPQAFQASAITPFIFLRALGLSITVARAVQLAVSLGACLMTYRVWTDARYNIDRLTPTLFLCLLAMPYGYIYDMTGYAAALALILQRRQLSLIWIALWLWPVLARMVTVEFSAPVTSLVNLFAVIWCLQQPADQTIRG